MQTRIHGTLPINLWIPLANGLACFLLLLAVSHAVIKLPGAPTRIAAAATNAIAPSTQADNLPILANPAPVPAPVCRAWTIVPSPNVGAVNNLKAVAALSASDIWAVGSYNNGLVEVKPDQWENPFPNQTLALHWNGAHWAQIPSPNVGLGDNYLSGVAVVSHSDVWAVGHYNQARIKDGYGSWRETGPAQTLILHWDGKGWKIAPTPNLGNINTNGNSRLTAISAIASNDIWATGYFGDNDDPYQTGKPDQAQTLILHWNGAQWGVTPSPSPGPFLDRLYAISAASKNDVWAVGDQSGKERDFIRQIAIFPLALHWDGKVWTEATLPGNGLYGDGKTLFGAKAFANTALAVGVSGSEGAVEAMAYRRYCAHWLNVNVPSPQAPTDAQPDNFLTAIAGASSRDAWAVGSYSTVAADLHGNAVNTFILHWDGKLWTRVPSPNSEFTVNAPYATYKAQANELNAITALPTGDVWAVGSIGDSNRVAKTLVMRYTKGPCTTTKANAPNRP